MKKLIIAICTLSIIGCNTQFENPITENNPSEIQKGAFSELSQCETGYFITPQTDNKTECTIKIAPKDGNLKAPYLDIYEFKAFGVLCYYYNANGYLYKILIDCNNKDYFVNEHYLVIFK